MFREMRRAKQLLTAEQSIEILEKGSSGVLAVLGDGGYPYAVPLSYLYLDKKLFFHAAKSGHKLDAIKSCDKASFCVVEQDTVVPERYTTFFRSVIAFGRVYIVEDEAEIKAALAALAKKYSPTIAEAERMAAVEKDLNRVCMIALDIEHLTGKEALELVRQRSTEKNS